MRDSTLKAHSVIGIEYAVVFDFIHAKKISINGYSTTNRLLTTTRSQNFTSHLLPRQGHFCVSDF
jgi:hypothetical protein